MRKICEAYWRRVNRPFFLLLLCAIPAAILFPGLSLVLPPFLLYPVCGRFLSLGRFEENKEDSLRFMTTLPFARKEICRVYQGGVFLICVGYGAPVLLARCLLCRWPVVPVMLWTGGISTVSALLHYTLLFAAALILAALFLMSLLTAYSLPGYRLLFTLSLTAVPLGLFLLARLAGIFQFINGSAMQEGVAYSLGEITHMQSQRQAAEQAALVVTGLLDVALFLLLLHVSLKNSRRFSGELER